MVRKSRYSSVDRRNIVEIPPSDPTKKVETMDTPIRKFDGPNKSKKVLLNHCPQCAIPFNDVSNRQCKEKCGHVTCRSCFIENVNGCPQCLEHARLRSLELLKSPSSGTERSSKGLVTRFQLKESSSENTSSSTRRNFKRKSIRHLTRQKTNKKIKIPSKSAHKIFEEDVILNDKPSKRSFLNSSISYKIPETQDSHQKSISTSKNEGSEKSKLSSVKLSSLGKPKGTPREMQGKKKRKPVLIPDHIIIIRSQNGDPIMYECNLCRRKFKTKVHIKYHEFCQNGNKPYKCDLCGQGFISKSHFEYHLRTHTGERPFVCPTCGRGFNQQGKVTRHMLSHTGEKPFVCEKCNRGFVNKQALETHFLIHRGEKPFACEYCDKRFRAKTNLNKHNITHTGERPFMCTDCGKSFGQKWNLKLHLRTHSSERPYLCDQCSFAFSSSKDLRRHLVIHSGERPFKCLFCKAAFCRKDNLLRHIKNIHKQPSDVAKQLANDAAAKYLALKSSKGYQEEKDQDKNSKTITPVQTATDETISLSVKTPSKLKRLQEATSSKKFPAIAKKSAMPKNDFKRHSTECQGTDGLQVLETSNTDNIEKETSANKSLQLNKSDSEIADSIAGAINTLNVELDDCESGNDDQNVTITVVYGPDGTTHFITDNDASKGRSDDKLESKKTATVTHVLGLPFEISVPSQFLTEECYTNSHYQMTTSKNDTRLLLNDKIQKTSEECSNKESSLKWLSNPESIEERINADSYSGAEHDISKEILLENKEKSHKEWDNETHNPELLETTNEGFWLAHASALAIVENEVAKEGVLHLINKVGTAQSENSTKVIQSREIGQKTELNPGFQEPLSLNARDIVPGDEDCAKSPKSTEADESCKPLKNTEKKIPEELVDPTPEDTIVCNFDFSKCYTMVCRESGSRRKSPGNCPYFETEIKRAIINPLRLNRTREYYSNYFPPKSASAVSVNTEVKSAPDQDGQNEKRKLSNISTSCAE